MDAQFELSHGIHEDRRHRYRRSKPLLTLASFTNANGNQLVLFKNAVTGEPIGVGDLATYEGREVNWAAAGNDETKEAFLAALRADTSTAAARNALVATVGPEWCTNGVPLSRREVRLIADTGQRFHSNPILASNTVSMENFLRYRADPRALTQFESVFLDVKALLIASGRCHLENEDSRSPELLRIFRNALTENPEFERVQLNFFHLDPAARAVIEQFNRLMEKRNSGPAQAA